MAQREEKGAESFNRLPHHQMRNIDGHQAFTTLQKNAQRMSVLNKTKHDPGLDEEEFSENLKDFFPHDD